MKKAGKKEEFGVSRLSQSAFIEANISARKH